VQVAWNWGAQLYRYHYLWYVRFIMNFEDRMRETRERLARDAKNRENFRQAELRRNKERYEARTELKEYWGKIAQAIVQSGIEPDVKQVATPQGIKRANEVYKSKPRGVWTKSFFGTPIYSGVSQEEENAWHTSYFNAVGSLYQPAWDMEYEYKDRHDGGRLFLAQDATIYTKLDVRDGDEVILRGRNTLHGAVIPTLYAPHYPISTYMELNDTTHITIERALAHMVVRRELTIEGIPSESS
jgi:hypothetical protein